MSDKNYRLPSHVRPERYVFEVAPNRAAKTFSGTGYIELVVDNAVSAIEMHGVKLTVQSATLGSGEASTETATVTSDEVSQTLKFAFDREIPAGRVRLNVKWTGIYHPDLRGLYLAGDVSVTQFEAADARRMFPCFDEPSFKAEWKLCIAVLGGASDGAILSNSPVERIEQRGDTQVYRFLPTPKMSSYLVACVLGNLKGTEERVVRSIPIRTWAVPDKAHLTGFAQDCAAAALDLLWEYFDTPYVFKKLDQVGIPDFEAGAMENSGLVTFREVVLLMDSEKAPLAVRKRVAEVITHELAHQWFGNLVTMQWWDDLWLNEAFATWMAYKIVHQWKPQWRMWDDFENGKATALALDAMDSTHPIRYEVKNADQATENFDAITYEKGGAILRMLEGFLGAEKFRAGIRGYMKKHAFANATALDLWNALGEASGQPIAEIANNWISQSGHPVISVARTGNSVKLSQERFFLDPAEAQRHRSAGDARWPVPVVLAWADDAGQHVTPHLLAEREGQITLPAQGAIKCVCGNSAGAGFYRVQYAPADLAALKSNAKSLLPVERMNLVADAWALFRAGKAELEPVLDLLAGAGTETDYAVLGEMVGRIDLLDRRAATTENRPAFQKFVTGLFAQQLKDIGYDWSAGESDAKRLQRAQIIRAVALIGRDPAAIAELSRRYDRSRAGDDKALDPNLLDVASVVAARAGSETLFDELVRKVETDPDPASKRRMLVALACFESPSLKQRVTGLFLTDTVPMQDATTFLGALLGNRPLQARAWDFIRDEWPAVRRKTAAPMLTRRLVESLGELVSRRAEVESFFDAKADSLSATPAAVKQTRERLRLDEDVSKRATPALAEWLKKRG